MKLNVFLKVSDRFGLSIQNSKGAYILEDYDDYVPDFMPGEHYGDYVDLEIDAKTGKILNWRPEVMALLNQFIEDQKSIGED